MLQNISKKEKNKKKNHYVFFQKRRFELIVGFILQGLSFFLFFSFISFFYYGKYDQSTIESIKNLSDLALEDNTIYNWFGFLGAISAYYFIYRWFGVTAFFIPFLLYLIGHRLVYRKELISCYRAFIFATFLIFWINITLGYVYLLNPKEYFLTLILGGIGYELAIFLYSLVGWGMIIFLLLFLIVFLLLFFDINFFKEKKIIKKKKNTPDTIKPTNNIVSPINLDIAVDTPIFNVSSKDNNTPSQNTEKKACPPDFFIQEKDNQESFSNNVENYDPKLDLSGYIYPLVHLLAQHTTTNVQVTKEELEQNKDKIIETLINFKIGIASIKATIGPTVTLYEIIPEAGIKISKIKNLEDDIALSLAALGIRIIAPIPGKGTIGIEVPNKQRAMVPLCAILGTDKFMKSSMELPIVMGKTISNEIFVADLAKMPHLLIAGATGQGKSVGLNVVLTSLIYKKHPSQLKLILVDPKKVELSLYNKLEHHFLAKLPDNEEPIITETKKVIYTLNSLCKEMDNRYELLKEAGVRNIKEYNEKFVNRRLNPEKGHQFLPYIVLVIDEFADMMMTAGKEIEIPIARLAQLARAIGIHLVLATQRPSVNVITGIIKANFPVRLSFRVTSKIDSRTILDTGGAEQLVGQGDMLLSMNSEIVRLQCPFIDTEEVDNVCDYIKTQKGYESAYLLPEYETEMSDELVKNTSLKGEQDELFKEAAYLIVAHQQGSTSLIQRKLKLGYNRAGRIIDQLEALGIVGPFEGSKAREVLVTDVQQLDKILSS